MTKRLGFLCLALVLGLTGCAATPDPPGRWLTLPVKTLHLAPLKLAADAGRNDPRVCDYARRDLQRNLVRSLPGRLAPVAFAPPDEPPSDAATTATLRITITRCLIESHQWDVGGGEPDITFYQTLGLRLQLTDPQGDSLLDHRLETVEQIQTDVPTPIFEFPHRVPAARIYSLFSQGRYWRSEPAGGATP